MRHLKIYLVHNFLLHSDLALPCSRSIKKITDGNLNHNISIQREEFLDHRLQQNNEEGHNGEIDPTKSIFLNCDYLDYQVSIFVDAVNNKVYYSHSDNAEHYAGYRIINSVIPLFTLLQGGLPLHAASVSLDGKFIGLIAPSRTGKSTLSWQMMQFGALFGSDDVLPLYEIEKKIIGTPSMSLFPKIRESAIDALKLERDNCRQIFPGERQFWVPVPEKDRVMYNSEVSALFFLQPKDIICEKNLIEITKVRPMWAIQILYENAHSLRDARSFIKDGEMFSRVSTICSQIPLYIVRYQKSLGNIENLAKEIWEVTNRS